MASKDKTTLQTERLRQSLQVVPMRNRGVTQLPASNERELHLEVTLVYGTTTGLLRRLLGARSKRSYVLEGVGREVYQDIDGRSTFEELIDRFAARHKLSFFESRALLAQYYQMLTKRGLIVATLPKT